MVSLTARGRRSIIAALVLVAVAMPTAALAQEAPFTVTFENLAPGAPQSTSFTYDLPQDAVLRSVTWTEQVGILEFADLEIVVCDASGVCVTGTTPDDTVLSAGPITITVTASITNEAPQDSSGSASGELSFAAAEVVEEDGNLPYTGAWLAEMAAWAAALVSIGALVVAVARRRDTEEAR